MLAPAGQLHVVDFGQQEQLPHAFRSALRAWLAKFHVTPRAHLREVMQRLAEQEAATVEFTAIKGGYAWRFTLVKRAQGVLNAAA
jgi:S-adenosylmethionine-diacylgycerolhomoserine-N-methlytransferase